MSTEPVRIHIPKIIPALSSVSFILEDEITQVGWILNPVCLFWNTSLYDLDLQVQFRLDFGVSTNIYETGTFTDDLIPLETILPNGRRTLPIREDVAILTGADLKFPITHICTVTNNDPLNDAMCRFLLSGVFDEVLRQSGLHQYVLRVG